MKDLLQSAAIAVLGAALLVTYAYVASDEDASKFSRGFWEAPFHTSDGEFRDPYLNTNSTATGEIQSFDDCAAAGFPVMESYPRQCRTDEGKHFVEDAAPPRSPV